MCSSICRLILMTSIDQCLCAQHVLAHWTLKTTWELGTVGSTPTQQAKTDTETLCHLLKVTQLISCRGRSRASCSEGGRQGWGSCRTWPSFIALYIIRHFHSFSAPDLNSVYF